MIRLDIKLPHAIPRVTGFSLVSKQTSLVAFVGNITDEQTTVEKQFETTDTEKRVRL